MTRFAVSLVVALACCAGLARACDVGCAVQVQAVAVAPVYAPVQVQYVQAAPVVVQAVPVYSQQTLYSRAAIAGYGEVFSVRSYNGAVSVQSSVIGRRAVVRSAVVASPVVVNQSVVARRGLFGRSVVRSRTVVR